MQKDDGNADRFDHKHTDMRTHGIRDLEMGERCLASFHMAWLSVWAVFLP